MKKQNIPLENIRRANAVRKAIEKYSGKGESLRTCIQDVLGDLRHLCTVEGLDFDEVEHVAIVNYRAESECCMCPAKLTSKDSAIDADNVCQKCRKKLKPGQTIPSRFAQA